MKRKNLYSVLFVVFLAVSGLTYTLVKGNEPLLGLDLQGGVSVVLKPTEEASDSQLEQTVEILRSRVDDIGVAEPEISHQGQNIVVALPGVVQDQQDALDRLSQTAELRFRPVIAVLGNPNAQLSQDELDNILKEQGITDDSTSTSSTEGSKDNGTKDSDNSTETTSRKEDKKDSTSVSKQSMGAKTSPVGFKYQDTTATSKSESTKSTGTSTGNTIKAEDGEVLEIDPEQIKNLTDQTESGLSKNCSQELTPIETIKAEDYVTLQDDLGVYYCLGPTLLTGEALETATAGLTGVSEWSVLPTFRDGPEGIDLFNNAASACYNANPEICPAANGGRGQLAAVLDFKVISAPTINAARFSRDQITISGSFDQDEAEKVASALKFGALPIELQAQETRTVSATIGRDVLDAGVISGLIGLALVAIYLIFYYRLAGLVAISGLAISGMLLWTVVAYFGAQYGLALTISGVVGLIVSIGVSADSNIVYFENVKEIYDRGTKLSTASERAYKSSISTIVKADVVSLIAAVLLYFLAVGAVRGFAFYLGLATLLDLFISVTFMRPALVWISRRSLVKKNPRLLGMPKEVSE